MDEIASVYRPYTKRLDTNINTGRSFDRTAYEWGLFRAGKKDYATFYGSQNKGFQDNAVGVIRRKLLKTNKIKFSDLVDVNTGEQVSLKKLGFTLTGKPIK